MLKTQKIKISDIPKVSTLSKKADCIIFFASYSEFLSSPSIIYSDTKKQKKASILFNNDKNDGDQKEIESTTKSPAFKSSEETIEYFKNILESKFPPPLLFLLSYIAFSNVPIVVVLNKWEEFIKKFPYCLFNVPDLSMAADRYNMKNCDLLFKRINGKSFYSYWKFIWKFSF